MRFRLRWSASHLSKAEYLASVPATAPPPYVPQPTSRHCYADVLIGISASSARML